MSNSLKGLLHARHVSRQSEKATETYRDLQNWIVHVHDVQSNIDFASAYGELACFELSRSDYSEAYRWSLKASSGIAAHVSVQERVNVYIVSIQACLEIGDSLKVDDLFRNVCQDYEKARQSDILYTDKMYADILKEYVRYLLKKDTSLTCHVLFIDYYMLEFLFQLKYFDSVKSPETIYKDVLTIYIKMYGRRNVLTVLLKKDLGNLVRERNEEKLCSRTRYLEVSKAKVGFPNSIKEPCRNPFHSFPSDHSDETDVCRVAVPLSKEIKNMSREMSSSTANVDKVSFENSAEVARSSRSDVTDRGGRPGSKKSNAIARPGSKKSNLIVLTYGKNRKRTIKDKTWRGIPGRITYRTDKEEFVYLRVPSHFLTANVEEVSTENSTDSPVVVGGNSVLKS
ncbi:hypothetical protein AVEN_143809-1 [Araneus ventricosus]|uniref:Uncharacterized protein n=1 Tax=Araneus ventricosus TaxID=182803 RepID=A0A4Y2W780_ARAVE|nr:hypothetical protein AVEN_131669-1 [Araneus ventricosus]GBO42459.1 hypothetical protein AVEN_143809-1 [Araneus ventricosus]